jgi:cyclic beta-1,2-glucan synthetase
MAVQVSPSLRIDELTSENHESNSRQWADGDQISGIAKQLAEQDVIAPKMRGDANLLLKRCREDCRALETATSKWTGDDHAAASLREMWLSERAGTVLTLISQVREQLPKTFVADLPYVRSGVPRAYAVAAAMHRHLVDLTDEARLAQFLKSYQTVSPLTIAEIWALPAMLCIAMVEELRRLVTEFTVPHRTDSASNGDLPSPVNAAVALDILLPSLRTLTTMNWSEMFEKVSLVEAILNEEPDQIYGQMDLETKERYRREIQQLSRRTGEPEAEVARRVVELAEKGRAANDGRQAHIGYYLIDCGRQQLEKAIGYSPKYREAVGRFVLKRGATFYLGSIAALTAIGVAAAIGIALVAGGSPFMCLLSALLALIPASELAMGIVNYWVTRSLPMHTLPKMELRTGIPTGSEAIVVIPTMLLNEQQITGMVETLESHFLANPERNLTFALLTDFGDAPEARMPEDDDLLAAAMNSIRRLNERYALVNSEPGVSHDRFFLFQRARQLNDADGVWMGWERKRGKLIEFNRFLLGDTKTSYLPVTAEVAQGLSKTKYVITLDSDTILPHQAARRLVGTLSHPLNRPLLAKTESGHCVTAGYAMLQPRIRISLAAAHRSPYSWMNVCGAGLNPYVTGASDVYQDLFQEGSFIGKGIYDVAAFQATLDQAFPANYVLSHDLIEGCHARAGLVTDVELVDGFPARYDADARRQHRWTRGDWQLLPWLLPNVPTASGRRSNPLSLMSRWKVLDNMRRSLVPTTLLILLIAGWTFLPGSSVAWTVFALLVPALPLFWDSARVLGQRRPGATWSERLRNLRDQVGKIFAQTVVSIAMLPHRAQMFTDATVRALVRMLVTRRQLLEWETAAAAESRLSSRNWAIFAEMWFPPLFALGMAIVAINGGLKSAALLPAIPLLVLWFISPLMAHWISQPTRRKDTSLSADQRQWLWEVARKTWAYFHTYVGPEDHYLPPDNIQDTTEIKVAHRISPTNEGLFLVSALAAHDLGLIELQSLADLVTANLDTWEKLPQHRGHHFNWYDTQTLQPLTPRYVSTVDSGNLLACLLTVQQGFKDLAARKRGPLREQLQQISKRCGHMAQAMEFRFLFNPKRKLFHIGLNFEKQKLDAAHYDLLASEARLASYVAIAKGNVDHHHWFQLGRRMTKVGDQPCLRSWSGSMFEYLMPTLFIPTIENSMLDGTCRAAVKCQIEYGREHGVPWGISESSFAEFNDSGDFGYQAFGVPSLGTQAGLDRDLVIAPYASALALGVDASEAAKNLQELAEIGALGRWGFVDAVDYTPRRQRDGQKFSIVPCYMAHHQGMTMAALANCLRDNCMVQRFRSHPAVHAVELILEERIPDEVPAEPVVAEAPAAEPVAAPTETAPAEHNSDQTQEPLAPALNPETMPAMANSLAMRSAISSDDVLRNSAE